MTTEQDDDRYVNPAAAARFTGYAAGTLRNWRSSGRGPAYVKTAGKRGTIRYRISDLRAFMQAGCGSEA